MLNDIYCDFTISENDIPIISMVNIVGVGNGDTVSLFSDHASASSDDNTNTLENDDDGYEKPYTTLVVQNRVDDENGYSTSINIIFVKEAGERSLNIEKKKQILRLLKQTHRFTKMIIKKMIFTGLTLKKQN